VVHLLADWLVGWLVISSVSHVVGYLFYFKRWAVF